MVGEMKQHHQFVVSNDNGVIIRCCVHCGLSHQMKRSHVSNSIKQVLEWELILEETGEETFAQPCPVENGSDELFPYHHFILSNHHQQNHSQNVIRFCTHCGLSHILIWIHPSTLGAPYRYSMPQFAVIPCWERINEGERDLTISDLCPVAQESEGLQRRYVPTPRN